MNKLLTILYTLFLTLSWFVPPCDADGLPHSTAWENSISSSTNFFNYTDGRNNSHLIEQDLSIKSTKIFKVPMLNYDHESSYGVLLATLFYTDETGKNLQQAYKFVSNQSATGEMYKLTFGYDIYTAYDMQGNYDHEVTLNVMKSWHILEPFWHCYLDAGYVYSHYISIPDNVAQTTNDRDAFSKAGLYYEDSKYVFGIDYKRAYDLKASSYDSLLLYSSYKF